MIGEIKVVFNATPQKTGTLTQQAAYMQQKREEVQSLVNGLENGSFQDACDLNGLSPTPVDYDGVLGYTLSRKGYKGILYRVIPMHDMGFVLIVS